MKLIFLKFSFTTKKSAKCSAGVDKIIGKIKSPESPQVILLYSQTRTPGRKPYFESRFVGLFLFKFARRLSRLKFEFGTLPEDIHAKACLFLLQSQPKHFF